MASTVTMTAERYDYLHKLNTAITMGSEIVGLSSKDTRSDSQNFYVDVATPQGKEVKQVSQALPCTLKLKTN